LYIDLVEASVDGNDEGASIWWLIILLILCVVGTLIYGAAWLRRRYNNKIVIVALKSRPASHENPMYGVTARRCVEAAPRPIAEAVRLATHANPTYESVGADAIGLPGVVYSVPTAEGGSVYATVAGPNDAHALGPCDTVMDSTLPAEEGVANGVYTMAPYDTVMSFAIPTEDGGSVICSTSASSQHTDFALKPNAMYASQQPGHIGVQDASSTAYEVCDSDASVLGRDMAWEPSAAGSAAAYQTAIEPRGRPGHGSDTYLTIGGTPGVTGEVSPPSPRGSGGPAHAAPRPAHVAAATSPGTWEHGDYGNADANGGGGSPYTSQDGATPANSIAQDESVYQDGETETDETDDGTGYFEVGDTSVEHQC
jgi:hypothetical protein